MEILVKKVSEEAVLPVYSKEAGPGLDLCSSETTNIAPRATIVVATGVAMAMPVGYVGVIWNKYSVVAGEKIRVTPGMIDSGYRQEIKIELTNCSDEECAISKGNVIAQLLIQQVQHAHLIEAEDLGSNS
jgi:dUTP pyrophosphatase